jgi:exopolysaccharide biosynthesis predicted pyruvyltransferase EpsI
MERESSGMSNQAELTRMLENTLESLEMVSTDRLYGHELAEFLSAEVLLRRSIKMLKEAKGNE